MKAKYFNMGYVYFKSLLIEYNIPIMGVRSNKVSVDHLDLVIKHLL